MMATRMSQEGKRNCLTSRNSCGAVADICECLAAVSKFIKKEEGEEKCE